MSNVFDLSRISRLVDGQHPARILVMDTNIIMNNPNPNNWSVKGGGKSIFVVSHTVVLELVSIRQKKGSEERLESSHKADIASKSLASLFGQGSIADGIPVKEGWVISVPSPKRDELDPELGQLKDIMDVVKPSDTKLLLLTRECHQLFRSTPVTLLTGDWDLYNVVEAQGMPCHLSRSFPIEELKEAAAIAAPVDWDKELAEAQARIVRSSIRVEATLTARQVASSWLVTGRKPFMMAQGYGVMRAGNDVRPFLWTIPFYPQTIEVRSSDDDEALASLPPIHLDFFGKDDFEQDLFDAIADRLLDCANLTFEEGKPTLQSPRSVMEMLLYFEHLLRKGASEGALEKLRQEVKESGGLIDYWTEWIIDAEDDDERYACLWGLIEALNSVWEIGQTYTFGIARGQEESPPE